MNPCAMCKRKGYCPEKCKPKADHIRHMKRLNRKIRQNMRTKRPAEEAGRNADGAGTVPKKLERDRHGEKEQHRMAVRGLRDAVPETG